MSYLYNIPVQIDEDGSGEISLWELFGALEMKQSKFTKRIFRYRSDKGHSYLL
ncbi:unnamed protein product [Scytosiphon promiscuus]